MPIQYDQIPVASLPNVPVPQPPVPQPQQPAQQPPVPHPVKKLLFAEIVLGEIILGIFVLCFIFGLLNYFNIISLSKSFPALGMLPHQTAPQPIATPFQYNAVKGDGELKQYIQSTLKPEFQPADIVSQGKITTQNDNIFTKNWFVGQTSFQTRFSFEPKTDNDSYISLLVGGTLPQAIKPNDTAAISSLLAKFLTTPASPSGLLCNQGQRSNICEQFGVTPIGKGGQAVSWTDNSFTIYSCYIPHSTVAHAGDATCVIGN